MPLDKAIVHELLAELDTGYASIFRSQLAELNVVDHSVDGKETMFYKTKLLRNVVQRKQLFPFEEIEEVVVRASVDLAGYETEMELYFVFGRFFSIKFRSDVSRFHNVSDVSVKLNSSDFP